MFTKEIKNVNFQEGELILIDKPLEWTSFDVVNKLRYLISKKHQIKKIKVGHAGTLDPLATGLLIICTGKFTKLIETYQAKEKEYVATIKLGATTPSFDRETEEDQQYPCNHISKEMVEQVVSTFLGEQEQVPPVFSAKKVDGKRAYDSARKGIDLELKPNKIVFYSIEIINYEFPCVTIKMVCSKGTYIRSFARDLGLALNSGGYLIDLRRTKIGDLSVENAMDIQEFEKNLNSLELN
jgi:tRNA pseudouridine55 synthase